MARAHWETLNALHWQLDVSFREDAARNRKDNGPADIAILRRRAAGVARSNTSRGSLSIKPKRAGWSDTFLLRLSQTVSRRLSQTRLPCGSGPFRSDTTIFDRKFRNYKDSGNPIVGTYFDLENRPDGSFRQSLVTRLQQRQKGLPSPSGSALGSTRAKRAKAGAS